MSDQIEKSGQTAKASPSAGLTERSTISSSWVGPLPPPNVLRAYDEAFPGCAERIVTMAESESAHRREQERFESQTDRMIVAGELASERRGMWLAFVLAILVIGVSAFLIYAGSLALGVGLVSLELISLVGLFIYGRNARASKYQLPQPPSPQGKLPFPE